MEYVSLGWSCNPAVIGVERGLRPRKEQGYKTCVFDMIISNQQGVIDCLNDDFKDFCNSKYLRVIQIPKESKYLNTNMNFVLYYIH